MHIIHYYSYSELDCPIADEKVVLLQKGKEQLDIVVEPNVNTVNALKALRGSGKNMLLDKDDVIIVDSKEPGDTFRLMDVVFAVTGGLKTKIGIIVLGEPDKEFVVSIKFNNIYQV